MEMNDMSKEASAPEKRSISFTTRFLKAFLPLAIGLAVISSLFLLFEVQTQKTLLQGTERSLVGLVSQTIEDDLQGINSDLFYLANLPQLIKFLDSGGKPPTELVANFKLFSKHKKSYDQIRYLDLNGMEIIRINYDGVSASVVPAHQLQSKAKRYYFEDALRLAKDEVFVSPFDLNMEHGKVETPLKPMIRFGTPVFDSQGNKQGIILLNYLGKELLSTLETYSGQSSSMLTMINSKGYWLKGIEADEEWGFMFADRQDTTLFNKFQSTQNLFGTKNAGQISNEDGLFTFTKVSPLTSNQTSSAGSSSADGASTARVDSDEYAWTIISYIRPERVHEKLYQSLDTIISAFCALFIFSLFISKLLTSNSIQKEKTASLVHAMAFHDALTDLPNRRLMDDRLHQTIAIADRSNCKVAVMFLDLDHFKPVNDTYGHETGDQLLKMVAERLRAGIRASDTASRLGGDEFVMIFTGISDPNAVEIIADKIVSMVAEPYSINGQEIVIGTSIGIAVYPDDTTIAEEVVQLADQALYGAKDKGRNCYLRYSELDKSTEKPNI